MNEKPHISRYMFEEAIYCEMCGDQTRYHKTIGQRLNQSQGLSPRKKTGISVSVMRCRNCGLLYAKPMPVPFNIQDHYGTPPEAYWRPEYFHWNPEYFSGEISTVKKILPFTDGMKALDIGAGLGKCMLSLEKAGFEAYGLEPSVPFYDRAVSKMGISSDRLKLGMLEEIDFPENYFDFITFGAVFEHLYHPAAGLEKALKWLKPGGIIHIEVPSSRHFIARIYNLFYRLRGTNYVTNLSPMHVPFHMYEFSPDSFLKLGKRLGYKIEKSDFYVCEIMHIPRIFHPVLRKYMQWTKTGMQLTVYLRK